MKTLMAIFYIVAGLNHFLMPGLYRRMMPPYLPAHGALIFLSGVAEVALGCGLFFERTRTLSAWGIILLLIAVFPANLYMYQERATLFAQFPVWLLLARLPVQLLLIAWAYVYTR